MKAQPRPLLNLSLIKVQHLIEHTCTQIEIKYVKIHTRKKAAKQFQRYLLGFIPAPLWDKLLNISSKPGVHPGILSDVFLHPRVAHVENARYLNNCDSYWAEKLKSMNNLVYLNLQLLCTDELLEIVGQNCPKLKFINCVSKIAIYCQRGGFNALRKELFVSDEGLRHLTKCRRLTTIKINNKLSSKVGGKRITYDGVQFVVKTLPCLEFFLFDNLGLIFLSGMERHQPLALKHVADLNATPENLAGIARACPNVQSLTLGNAVHGMEEVSKALVQTTLQPRIIHLKFHVFHNSFLDFLALRGKYLSILVFNKTIQGLTCKDVFMIGSCCPYLVELCVNVCVNTEQVVIPKQMNFNHLERLAVSGTAQVFESVLPLFLHNSPVLEYLSLFQTCEESLNDHFSAMMQHNRFLNLKSLCLDVSLSQAMAQEFFGHCCSLECISMKYRGCGSDGRWLKDFELMSRNITSTEDRRHQHYLEKWMMDVFVDV